MILILSEPQIDISGGAFTLEVQSNQVPVRELVAFSLGATIKLDNGKTLDAADWPHFTMKLFVSVDQLLDTREDLEVLYEMTPCQYEVLTKAYSDATSDLTLDDKGKKYSLFLR